MYILVCMWTHCVGMALTYACSTTEQHSPVSCHLHVIPSCCSQRFLSANRQFKRFDVRTYTTHMHTHMHTHTHTYTHTHTHTHTRPNLCAEQITPPVYMPYINTHVHFWPISLAVDRGTRVSTRLQDTYISPQKASKIFSHHLYLTWLATAVALSILGRDGCTQQVCVYT